MEVKRDEDIRKDFLTEINENRILNKNKQYVEKYIKGKDNTFAVNKNILFSHINQSYKKLVIEGLWLEKRFKELMLVLIHFNRPLTLFNFERYTPYYQEGQFNNIIIKAMEFNYGIKDYEPHYKTFAEELKAQYKKG